MGHQNKQTKTVWAEKTKLALADIVPCGKYQVFKKETKQKSTYTMPHAHCLLLLLLIYFYAFIMRIIRKGLTNHFTAIFLEGGRGQLNSHQSHSLGHHSGTASWGDWMSIPGQVACVFVFLMGSHTVPGQHSQPTPT